MKIKNMIFLLACFVGCASEYTNTSKLKENNLLKEEQTALVTVSNEFSSIQGNWSCKDYFGGKTIIKSIDHVEMELGSNQIWILGKLSIKSNNIYDILFVEALDVGRGGMNASWSLFSKSKPIGQIEFVSNDNAIKEWYGLYNTNSKEYEYEWGFDWDACDTIYRSENGR